MTEYSHSLITQPSEPMYQIVPVLIKDIRFSFSHLQSALEVEALEMSGNLDAFRS